MKSFTKEVADRELVEKLRDNGYSKLVEALGDPAVFTKAGRLNKCALCRLLKWKPVQVERALAGCRELLGDV